MATTSSSATATPGPRSPDCSEGFQGRDAGLDRPKPDDVVVERPGHNPQDAIPKLSPGTSLIGSCLPNVHHSFTVQITFRWPTDHLALRRSRPRGAEKEEVRWRPVAGGDRPGSSEP